MENLDFYSDGANNYFDGLHDIPPLFGDPSLDLDFIFDLPDPSVFAGLPVDYDMVFDDPQAMPSRTGSPDAISANNSIETSSSGSSFMDPEGYLPADIQSTANTDLQNQRTMGISPNKANDLNTRKRSWNEGIVIFSADGGKEVRPRRRKAFSESRKKEVARNRLVSACTQCKLRKGRCNFGIPCEHCIKRAGSIALGQEICKRQTLVNTRFDHLDMFQISARNAELATYMSTCSKTPMGEFYVGYLPVYDEDLSSTFIRVPVVEFECTSDITLLHFYATYNMCDYYSTNGLPHLIAPGYLPTLEWLKNAYKISVRSRESSTHTGRGPLSGLDDALTDFSNHYWESNKLLPQQKLIKKCLDLKLLLDLSSKMSFTRNSLSTEEGLHITTLPIHRQLKSIVCKEIVTLELEILSEIDRLVSGASQCIGRENPLGIWVVLWLLMLGYHHYMILVGFRRKKDSPQIYGLTKHIYNAITSVYNGLFKTTSPLTLDWRTEEVSHLLGNDPELIRLFCNVKTEVFWFQATANELRAEDKLFMKLVVENDNRLLKAHTKAAKKRGVI